MDQSILRGLNDKIYDRRKAAALELEKLVLSSDSPRISAIIHQLCGMFSSSNSALHTRNGGLIGLAATAIALGQDVAPFLGVIIPPVLYCFQDPESRVRYHACESLYNIAKVSKGEILVHFNEIFDALSKLSSDSEMSVKNGAELLDRLMKDIVAEAAPTYISLYPGNANPNLPFRSANEELATGTKLTTFEFPPVKAELNLGKDKDSDDKEASSIQVNGDNSSHTIVEDNKRAFSLARFIPLLSERVYVISPYTRMHLVSWVMVLDSVPDLELVAWLPEFLDGLLKYLADGSVDVRLATENVLAEFLREIRYIAGVQERQQDAEKARRETRQMRRRNSKQTLEPATEDTEDAVQDGADRTGTGDKQMNATATDPEENDWEGEGSGAWIPGQGVYVDYAAIMDIVIQHLSYPDELVQSTAMEWILTFLDVAQTTVVSFTPRIVPAILPNLASSHRHIKLAAHETNGSLYRVIQSLPLQVQPQSQPQPLTGTTTTLTQPSTATSVPLSSSLTALSTTNSPPASLTIHGAPSVPNRKDSGNTEAADTAKTVNDPLDAAPPLLSSKPSSSSVAQIPPSNASLSNKGRLSSVTPLSEPTTPVTGEFPTTIKLKIRPESPSASAPPVPALLSPLTEAVPENDPFDVRETVNVLTLQFLSDHAETRIAALEWLLMLHLKAPTKILSRESGTFPALLKTLSDPSEDVVKHDLQLLAQISASSEDAYFTSFMVNVLELFSTDRRLLETRGSLIIRQLCLHLNAERIFRTIAEILEKDDDLEFASMMVVKLNMILVTSPELADFRRRLKNLDSKDGQMLFSSLYRSWCHNAVAVFALCLLAQAYEHASNLLQIFAELELTVSLLVQIDKLVMLIESPVFTSLRLQLLEPEKYPFLPKCLYGLLMILPQSSAFVSLRARLSVVNSSGYAPTPPKAPPPGTFSSAASATRSKLSGKDEIKWQELLSHFRSVQARHEKACRQSQTGEIGSTSSDHFSSPSQTFVTAPVAARMDSSGSLVGLPKSATIKKKSTSNSGRASLEGGSRISGMSPLNPRRGPTRDSASSSGLMSAGVSIGGAVASMHGSQGLGSMTPLSPPPAGGGARKKILGGIRRTGGGNG